MKLLSPQGFGILALSLYVICAEISGQTVATDNLISTFRPWRVEHVTLSPDGTHLACSINDEDSASVEIIDVDHPAKPILLKVEENRLGSHWWSLQASAKRISYIGWAGNHRLVVLSNLDGLFAVDSDGKNPIKLGDSVSLGLKLTPSQNFNKNLQDVDRDYSKLGENDNLLNSNQTEEVKPRLIPRKLEVLWVPTENTSEITVEARGIQTDIYRINVETGACKIIYSVTGMKNSIQTDRTGQPRLELVEYSNKALKEYKLISDTDPKNSKKEKLRSLFTSQLTPQNVLGYRSIPMSLDPNPDLIYYASNIGRDTYGIFKLNLSSGIKTQLTSSESKLDAINPLENFDASPLIFDNKTGNLAGIHNPDTTTNWLIPELASVQKSIEGHIQHRTITLTQWDKAHDRFLFISSGPGEPGRYYLYFKSIDKIIQYFRRAPWIDSDAICPYQTMSIKLASGITIEGTFTQAKETKINPPPLVIMLHDGPWLHNDSGFDREAQLFTRLGVSVARINYRGSSGKGQTFQNSVRNSIDYTASEDILSTITYLADKKQIDPKRVIVMGYGFGGTLALRALELNPGHFKGAITTNAPTDIKAWINTPLRLNPTRSASERLDGMSKNNGAEKSLIRTMQKNERNESRYKTVDFDQELRKSYFDLNSSQIKEISPITHASAIKEPILMIQDSNGRPVTLDQEKNIVKRVRNSGTEAYVCEMQGSLYSIEPEARLPAYTAIEQFLNITLYNYTVNVGELKEKQ